MCRVEELKWDVCTAQAEGDFSARRAYQRGKTAQPPPRPADHHHHWHPLRPGQGGAPGGKVAFRTGQIRGAAARPLFALMTSRERHMRASPVTAKLFTGRCPLHAPATSAWQLMEPRRTDASKSTFTFPSASRKPSPWCLPSQPGLPTLFLARRIMWSHSHGACKSSVVRLSAKERACSSGSSFAPCLAMQGDMYCSFKRAQPPTF
jgi:hypothetical protein